jgi:hypothetical protein
VSLGRKRDSTGTRLHIATSLKIVAKHKHVPDLAVEQAGEIIRRLAAAQAHTRDEGRLVMELQQRTGLSIAALAKLTKEWLPGG